MCIVSMHAAQQMCWRWAQHVQCRIIGHSAPPAASSTPSWMTQKDECCSADCSLAAWHMLLMCSQTETPTCVWHQPLPTLELRPIKGKLRDTCCDVCCAWVLALAQLRWVSTVPDGTTLLEACLLIRLGLPALVCADLASVCSCWLGFALYRHLQCMCTILQVISIWGAGWHGWHRQHGLR